MSGGFLLRHAIRRLAAVSARKKMTLSVDIFLSIDHTFPQFLYDIGHDAGLPEEGIVARGIPLLYEYAAIHLCDDLSDGECSDIPRPDRFGPPLVMLFHHLALYELIKIRLPTELLLAAADKLTATGIAQLHELNGLIRNADDAFELASGLNGNLYSSFLQLMWFDTRYHHEAEKTGEMLGIVVHIFNDIIQDDQRFHSLPPKQRGLLLDMAQNHLDLLSECNSITIQRICGKITSRLSLEKINIQL